jgi:hypothetical protein
MTMHNEAAYYSYQQPGAMPAQAQGPQPSLGPAPAQTGAQGWGQGGYQGQAMAHQGYGQPGYPGAYPGSFPGAYPAGQYQSAYYAGYPSHSSAEYQTQTPFLNFSNERFLKGLLIGAAAAYLLTNESVQRSAIKGVVKVWSMLQGGVEEIKERFQDAEAEIRAAEAGHGE